MTKVNQQDDPRALIAATAIAKGWISERHEFGNLAWDDALDAADETVKSLLVENERLREGMRVIAANEISKDALDKARTLLGDSQP